MDDILKDLNIRVMDLEEAVVNFNNGKSFIETLVTDFEKLFFEVELLKEEFKINDERLINLEERFIQIEGTLKDIENSIKLLISSNTEKDLLLERVDNYITDVKIGQERIYKKQLKIYLLLVAITYVTSQFIESNIFDQLLSAFNLM